MRNFLQLNGFVTKLWGNMRNIDKIVSSLGRNNRKSKIIFSELRSLLKDIPHLFPCHNYPDWLHIHRESL